MMLIYKAFTTLLLLVHGISCKNKQASELTAKKANPVIEQNLVRNAIPTRIDQKSNTETTEESDLDESPKDDSKQTEQIDPSPKFSFLKEINIKVGETKSIPLEATGNTEGYFINSISINKNGNYCPKKI
ncbi:hypothetical protein [Cardinium endosymbiont of Nabis limbatus]|uniref:hypothetical protein n=1 Tax=Cardinium endosymbiont of Nabis limbatus TaxID=3066217 RepID=UPI003AF3E95E